MVVKQIWCEMNDLEKASIMWVTLVREYLSDSALCGLHWCLMWVTFCSFVTSWLLNGKKSIPYVGYSTCINKVPVVTMELLPGLSDYFLSVTFWRWFFMCPLKSVSIHVDCERVCVKFMRACWRVWSSCGRVWSSCGNVWSPDGNVWSPDGVWNSYVEWGIHAGLSV